MSNSLLLIGINEPSHVGGHLLSAAEENKLNTHFIDLRDAWQSPWWWRALCWRFAGHRPPRLRAFSQKVIAEQRRLKPTFILSTGIAPLDVGCLLALNKTGSSVANFLTDDPWNKQHHAPWFMRGLKHYNHIFSPRRANMADLAGASKAHIHYLPFAYAPKVHFPPQQATNSEIPVSSRALFIGGADADRIATMKALHKAGVPLELWGGYWQLEPTLKAYAKGHATAEDMRKLISTASVNICLVRKANRDGHSMRSFEVPAMGGCMVLEDTQEHREIFGADQENAYYFANEAQLSQHCATLISQPLEVQRLRRAAHKCITIEGDHTYSARLRQIVCFMANQKAGQAA